MIRTYWQRLTTATPAALAVGLGLIHGTVAFLAFDPTPHSGGDNAAYLILASSLLDRGAYLQLWDPLVHAHAQYPPGFPALLAGALALGIDSWTALKGLMIAVSGIAVGLSYLWARERATPGLALGVGLLLALSPGVVENSHWVLSDIPFWAATMATLWFAARDRPVGAVGFAFAALLLRTAALPLVMAVAVWLALRRRWRWTAGVLGMLVLLAGAWSLRADPTYTSQLWLANPYVLDEGTIGVGGLFARILGNGRTYAFGIMMTLLSGSAGLLADLFGAALLAFAAIGWARRIRSPGVPEILLPLYLGMILVWPGPWAADRLLLPVLPVLILLAGEGLGILPRRAPGMLRVTAVTLLLLVSAPALYRQWEWGARCREAASEFPSACLHPEVRAFMGLAAWTEGKLPPGSAVLSRKPTFFYFYARVPGRTYPFTSRPGALFEEAERAGARYVVLDRLGVVSASYLLPVVAANPERFCAIQAMDLDGSEAVLLGILPEDAPGPPPETREDGGTLAVDFPICGEGFLR